MDSCDKLVLSKGLTSEDLTLKPMQQDA